MYLQRLDLFLESEGNCLIFMTICTYDGLCDVDILILVDNLF